jgi:two-component system, LytTR family, sensor kinase
MENFFSKSLSFWKLQIFGWILYFIAIYITFLSVALPENFGMLFFLKGFRALTGLFLTSVFLRQIYRYVENRLSISWVMLVVLISAIVFGCLWTVIETCYFFLTIENWDMTNYLVRSPRIALDYAMTLTAWSALYLGVKNWLAWQKEREKSLQANYLADKAQLEVLRYQLNPHFLFNALNSIRASVDEDKNRAKQMITSLSEFLRHSLLSVENKEIPLHEELEAVKNYMAIEKIRFEEKLEIEYDIEKEAEDFKIPSLLLNPLVENAIKHGLQTSVNPLKLIVSAKLNNKNLLVQVANSGKLDNLHNSNGTKIGLKNVRERLEKLYGEKGSLALKQEGEFVVAEIEIHK